MSYEANNITAPAGPEESHNGKTIKRRSRRWIVIILGILLMLIGGGMGGWFGAGDDFNLVPCS